MGLSGTRATACQHYSQQGEDCQPGRRHCTKHHQCHNSELLSPSSFSCCLLPVTAKGEEIPWKQEVVAVSEVWTKTPVLLYVLDQDRASTGDGEPVSYELQGPNCANSQG